jgi:splicing suppressor protein 51
VTLKRCSKCSVTQYCSHDCQKTDWKNHKKTCGKQPATGQSGTTTATAPEGPPPGLTQAIVRPFTRLDNGTWLHDRPESDVYTLLIDAYRMRIEDDYSIDGDAAADSIYGGQKDSRVGFAHFLTRIEKKKRALLPAWWSEAHKKKCIDFGLRDANGWSSLEAAVEKADINEHYGNSQFAMQLRMFPRPCTGAGLEGAMEHQ